MAQCARTCGLCIPIVVPVQVATLRNGRLPIPDDAGPIIIEIGSSDRNTVDKELLDEVGMEKALCAAALRSSQSGCCRRAHTP